MKNYNRDLLVCYKMEAFDEDLLQREVECLHSMLLKVENDAIFCRAHQLVTRNRITGRARAILRAAAEPEMKPFSFLINKN